MTWSMLKDKVQLLTEALDNFARENRITPFRLQSEGCRSWAHDRTKMPMTHLPGVD